MRSFFSNTVTSWPARASCCAAARPAGPEPTTATFLPVLAFGGCGMTQPSAQARSMMACSIDLMPTGSSLTFSVQAASHGAGQTRPVNSGKLLVECSTSIALFQSSRIHQVVEVGNDVVDRAAAVAERRAAVHAARALDLGLLVVQGDDEFLVVLQPLLDGLVAFFERSYSRKPVTFPMVFLCRWRAGLLGRRGGRRCLAAGDGRRRDCVGGTRTRPARACTRAGRP